MPLPFQVLESFLNQRVSLLLKDNREIVGKFVGYDDYMNMVLVDAEEINAEISRKLGIVVLRGATVVRITLKES